MAKYRKVYVGVKVQVDSEGNAKPVSIIWENGEEYLIDRVKYKIPAASLKVGGRGIRYTVIIKGAERHLYDEAKRENGLWKNEQNKSGFCGKFEYI